MSVELWWVVVLIVFLIIMLKDMRKRWKKLDFVRWLEATHPRAYSRLQKEREKKRRG